MKEFSLFTEIFYLSKSLFYTIFYPIFSTENFIFAFLSGHFSNIQILLFLPISKVSKSKATYPAHFFFSDPFLSLISINGLIFIILGLLVLYKNGIVNVLDNVPTGFL